MELATARNEPPCSAPKLISSRTRSTRSRRISATASSTQENTPTIWNPDWVAMLRASTSRNRVWSSIKTIRMGLVSVIRKGLERRYSGKLNQKAALFSLSDVLQLATVGANNGARNIQPEASGSGAVLERLKEAVRGGYARTIIGKMHDHGAAQLISGDGHTTQGPPVEGALAVLDQIEEHL